MKIRLLALVFCLLSILSCRDDFTLEGPFQDIPLAFGFLDAEDDRHFIRVQKAFLEAGGDAATVAGIPDSIYYGAGDASVILENVATGQSTELERVNGQDFGLNREDGVFAQSPNVLYTLRDDDLRLDGGNRARLIIQRPGQPDAVAETTLLRPLTITRPTTAVRLDDYNRPVLISWSKEVGTEIYDVRISFRISEFFPDDPDRNRERRLEWTVDPAFVPGGDQQSSSNVRFDVSPESFYQFLGDNLEEVDGVVRRFRDFDLIISAAGREVIDRRTLENANSGITSSQSLPRYTNLSNGLGIFTSVTREVQQGIQFDQNSVDSLRNGIYTRDLGFQ